MISNGFNNDFFWTRSAATDDIRDGYVRKVLNDKQEAYKSFIARQYNINLIFVI